MLAFAEFFDIYEPGSNHVPPGSAVMFGQVGQSDGSAKITSLGPTTFRLADPGIYSVQFDVPVTVSGQLELTLDGAALACTVTGVGGDGGEIAGHALIPVPADAVLSVVNPPADLQLDIDPHAGGVEPVSATLVIRNSSALRSRSRPGGPALTRKAADRDNGMAIWRVAARRLPSGRGARPYTLRKYRSRGGARFTSWRNGIRGKQQ